MSKPSLSPHHHIRYVDSHIHLDRYTDDDAAALLERASQAGVGAFLTIGVDRASSRRAVALAGRFGTQYGVYAAVGLHPAFLSTAGTTSIDRDIEQLSILAQSSPAHIVAVGEFGLDTLDVTAALDTQLYAFATQLQLANDLGLPMVIHVQGEQAIARAQDLYAAAPARLGAVVHYFVGDLPQARRWLDLGCHISVGRPVTRQANAGLRAAIASPALPLDRLLIETDTYPLPGRVTEPAHVVTVAAEVAALKDLPIEQVAHQTTANFMRLFRLTA
ncbi:MAG TPA: TatD family hydrolase [Ktedonobacterales bacterium]